MQETTSVVEQGQPGGCVHRWVLGEPHLGFVKGACRRCGAQRAFPAGLEVPAPAPEGEEEPVVDLADLADLPALASAVSSLNKHALI
jgi:hypothetical protein